MGDHAYAQAPWQAPYHALAGERFFLRYIEYPQFIPLGIYDHEDDIPGVQSVELPSGWLSKGAKTVTQFLEQLDDLVPGLGDFLPTPWR